MNKQKKKILEFCLIQMEVVKDRETTLRKQLLNCKIQNEFLSGMIEDLKSPIERKEND